MSSACQTAILLGRLSSCWFSDKIVPRIDPAREIGAVLPSA